MLMEQNIIAKQLLMLKRVSTVPAFPCVYIQYRLYRLLRFQQGDCLFYRVRPVSKLLTRERPVHRVKG